MIARKYSRGGTAAIEFALCLPLTFLLAAAIVDLGRAISFKHALQRAARDAARVAAAVTTNADGEIAEGSDIEAAGIAHATAAIATIVPSCGGSCQYTATWAAAADQNEYVEVTIRAPHASIFGVVPGLTGEITNKFTVMTRVQE